MNRYYATRRHDVIEPLEKRAMMAAEVDWDDANGILSISESPFGPFTNDFVTIGVDEAKQYISVTVGSTVWDGEDEGAEPSECKQIVFFGGGGDDSLDMTKVNSTNGFQANNLNGKISASGSDGRDSILGSAFADKIEGGDDATLTDRLIGNGDNDTIIGGDGPDHIEGGDGADSLVGGANNPFNDDDGNDTMYGGGHNDTLQGDKGDDSMYGSWGCDSIIGGDGANDTGLGEYGDDSFLSSTENINGGTGRDSIDGKYDEQGATVDGCGAPSSLMGGGGELSAEENEEWEALFAEASTEFQYLRKAFLLQLGGNNYRTLAEADNGCGCQSEAEAVFESLANSSPESRTRTLSRLALSRVDREELLMILEIAAARRP